MVSESDFLPVSALQHLLFCERQCALIHIEREWAENRLTAQGKVLHEAADSGRNEKRNDLFIARSVAIKSTQYGISGKADVVEFYLNNAKGVELPGRTGLWQPVPVEYKRGKPKINDCDRVQLCSQALCLEEMYKTNIQEGALYYYTIRRREIVLIDDSLRTETLKLIQKLHALIKSGEIPKAQYTPACKNCSLNDICQPELKVSKALKYYQNLFLPEEM